MKIAALISRLLLGLIFVFFGSNAFLHFLPTPPLPENAMGKFLSALFESHYVYVVGAVQVIGGLLLLIGLYVPLALTILGPVIVNILCYHILMDPKGIGPGLVVTILWFILFARYRQSFSSLFVRKPL